MPISEIWFPAGADSDSLEATDRGPSGAARSHLPHRVDDWFWLPRPRPEATTRLFCFAHAGGGPTTFTDLAKGLPGSVDVWAAQMPGRGSRLTEPCPDNLDELVAQLRSTVLPRMTTSSVLLGQSFGALLAYELARQAPEGADMSGLIVIGLRSPDALAEMSPANGSDLVDRLHLTAEEEALLRDSEMRDLVLSGVEADLRLCQSYRHSAAPALRTPIVAIVGDQDPAVTPDQMADWRRFTTGTFQMVVVPDGHLVVRNGAPHAISAVTEALNVFSRRNGDVGH